MTGWEKRRFEHLGDFARHLHLSPRDVDALTVEEFEVLVQYLKRVDQQEKAAAAQMGGGR